MVKQAVGWLKKFLKDNWELIIVIAIVLFLLTRLER